MKILGEEYKFYFDMKPLDISHIVLLIILILSTILLIKGV